MTSRLARAPLCSNARKLCFMSQVAHNLWPNCVSSMWSESESDMQMNWILTKKILHYWIYLQILCDEPRGLLFVVDADNFNQICRILKQFIDFGLWIPWTLFVMEVYANHCNAKKNTCKNNSVRLPNLGFCTMETSRVHDVTLERWPWVASLSIFSWGIYKNLMSLNTT